MHYRIIQNVIIDSKYATRITKFNLYLNFTPSKRTIFCYDHAGAKRAYFLQFPALLFNIQCRTYHNPTSSALFKFDYLHLYLIKDFQCFIPPLPNAYGTEICLGTEIEKDFISLENMTTVIMDYFWQMPFTQTDLGNISKYLLLYGNNSDACFILNKWQNDPQSVLDNLLPISTVDYVPWSIVDLSNYKKISSLKELYCEI